MSALPNTPSSEIDFNFRPLSYFFPMALGNYLLSTIKGTERRRDVEQLIAEGHELDVADWLAHSALDDDTRLLLGSIHPCCMGGEYLPDLATGQVEIARIELESVTSDVISVRATKSKNRIYYAIHDEYNTQYITKPRWSAKPLALKQIICLIEDASAKDGRVDLLGLCAHMDNYHVYDWDLEDCRTFTRITSAFYPELENYYHQAFEAWYQQCRSELEDEDEYEQITQGVMR